MKTLARAAVFAAAPLLSGCAATFGGYDLAPNGLPKDEDGLRRALAFEADRVYAEVIEGERSLPDDDLLRLLYAGTAGRYAGSYEESSRLLDVASYLAEDRVTYSLSREALSLVTSDRSLAYTPGRTERLMIPYVAALNYLEAGDPDGAAVEARRIEALLDRFDADTPREEIPQQSRFLHYFAGAVFEAARDWSAAEVAYRRSGGLAETLGTRRLGQGEASGSTRLVGSSTSDSLGDVVVLVERGFVPHKVEQSVVIVLPPSQAKMLTEGSTGEKAAAAAEAAARILLTASEVYGDRSGYYRDRGYRSPMHLEPWRDCSSRRERSCDEEDEDGEPYLLRLSWPVLYQEPAPTAPLRVRAGDLGVDAVARLDVSAAAHRDFEAERPAILARMVVRAAAKLGLSHSLGEAVGNTDEGAGKLVGVLSNLETMLTERADTRAWHLLPGSVAMVRLRLPPGTHDLYLEADGSRTGSGGASLGSVEVRSGTTTFVSTRIWQ